MLQLVLANLGKWCNKEEVLDHQIMYQEPLIELLDIIQNWVKIILIIVYCEFGNEEAFFLFIFETLLIYFLRNDKQKLNSQVSTSKFPLSLYKIW